MNHYTEEHTRLLKSLLKYHVKFILVGGHAAIYHGVNRNTGDLDILNYTPGIELRSAYENSVEETFSGLKIRIMNITDLIKNKEQLHRKGEKSLLDQFDVEVLKKILKRKAEK